jgi:hypothetical protein
MMWNAFDGRPFPPLVGALRYLIDADPDSIHAYSASEIVEVPYDYNKLHDMTQYGNLRSEEERFKNLNEADRNGKFKPYLPADDITSDYGEFTPDPAGPGFLENVDEQISRAVKLGAKRIEWDNSDSTDLLLNSVLRAHDFAWQKGLRTVAKNPLNVNDPELYTSHPSVDLIVVEKGDYHAGDFEYLRQTIKQPLLAVRFVTFGDGLGWARQIAGEINAHSYENMGVTHSTEGEYTSSQDVLVPRSCLTI